MTSRNRERLPALVQSYFQDHLRRVRGASDHTVRAFQHALRLYLLFLSEHLGRPLDRLSLDDIRAESALEFLDHIETSRGNCAATRNCRLAALRGFAAHLLRHDLSRAEQYRRILALPAKRSKPKPVTYLEPEEMRVLLAAPDRSTAHGARDHALLLFLYNTGARISEALSVHTCDLQFGRPSSVRIIGKGKKVRFTPIWPETANVLRSLSRGRQSEEVVFRNARGNPLSRDGAAYLLGKYVKKAAEKLPQLRRRRITPHVLRHSCAVAMLQAGNDLSVIRDFLGHASIATTGLYISTNLEMKRRALTGFWKRAGLDVTGGRPWRPTSKLLSYLTSL